MDSSVKSACFDEIAHTILDGDKKLTVKTISNNWDISLKDAASVMDEWISKNAKHNLNKEYLVKGSDQNGNGLITIVPDTKLDIIKKKLNNFSKIIHSIELASESMSKKLVVPEYDEIKMINLHMDSEQRDFDAIQVVPEEHVTSRSQAKPSVEKKKEVSVSSMFGSSSKYKNSTIDIDSEESKMDLSPVEVKKPTVSTKQEPRTPKKTEATTSNQKESPLKSKKDIKKAAPKNSIASFFIQAGNKPKQSATTNQSVKPDSPKRVKHELKTPETETDKKQVSATKKTESLPEKKSAEKVLKPVKSEMVTPKKTKESKSDSLKRSISAICDSENSEDDIIPTTPQPKKKPKPTRTYTKQNGIAKKRTRILQNESSDEDNSEEKKKGKSSSDIENMEMVQQSPKEETIKNKNSQNGDNSNGKRRKAKRTVTRTYEDSDGFFKTVKEVEEYSCSDDDVQVEKIKSPTKQNKKTGKNTTMDVKKSPTKQTPSKKTTEKPATKQGLIMNFFAKK